MQQKLRKIISFAKISLAWFLVILLFSIMSCKRSTPAPITEKPLKFIYGNPADWLLVMSYGQSNSTYSGADKTAKTLNQKYDAITQKGGILIYISNDASDIKPLVEIGDGGSGGGETLLSASLEKFTEQVRDENMINPNKKGFQFFGLVTGIGGQSIAALSKNASANTPWYANMMNCVKGVVRLGKIKNRSVSVPFLWWTQGEDDSGSGKSYDYYVQNLTQLINDLNADVKDITGQSNSFPLIGYQMCYRNPKVIDNRIPMADIDMGVKNPLFICACPSYMLKFDISDRVHFLPQDKRILGAYYGLAAKRTIVDGEKFLPLYPVGFEVNGNNLKITYHVPVPPLKFDTSLLPNSGNYGFKVKDSAGRELKLNNIQILANENAVSIDCSASPKDGIFMYARNNNYSYVNNPDGKSVYILDRGNLHDSQGDTVVFDIVDQDGKAASWPMHNWAMASYMPIK